MTKLMKTAALAGVLVAFLASTALELRAAEPNVREGQAVVTELDIVLGRSDIADHHAVARYSAVLFPGQVQVISVPYALGEQQQVLRVRRIDDRIEIARVPGSSNF